MKIAMTGASGNMGREALKQTLELDNVEWVRVLLSLKKKNNKLAKNLKKQYKDRIQIVRGSVKDEAACRALADGADYVIHMAAVIPPASDKSFQESEDCNLTGAVNMVNAVKAQAKQPKYIHVSTVALYGHRDQNHPWGRVGDPLLISPFDAYAMHKLEGERYCLEAGGARLLGGASADGYALSRNDVGEYEGRAHVPHRRQRPSRMVDLARQRSARQAYLRARR